MAYYALFKFKMMPWEYDVLNQRQKGALLGMIRVRIEEEKKLEKK